MVLAADGISVYCVVRRLRWEFRVAHTQPLLDASILTFDAITVEARVSVPESLIVNHGWRMSKAQLLRSCL